MDFARHLIILACHLFTNPDLRGWVQKFPA